MPVGPSQVNYASGNAFDSDLEALPPARAAHVSSSSGDPMLQFLTTQFETMHTHFDAQLETHYTTMTQHFDARFDTFKTEIRNDLSCFLSFRDCSVVSFVLVSFWHFMTKRGRIVDDVLNYV
ncbi:hypothetical protein Pyn_40093 [Prunus yedoensis var. nudiflora]|uniref:Uncharacterized protein n=1 Tax=Prunus yedoensis var. nudiflora TaxID=2094558 RepID=A0A314Y763_PRUYE|nr:hypothetical protein Pyn_40093 [Prunus yedoensis var. nudiflora]